jgi:hypothetical protein
MSAEDMARLLTGCDTVVVAALVGHTRDEKRAVLRAVGRALDPGAYLVVRSAHGLRSLLYGFWRLQTDVNNWPAWHTDITAGEALPVG